MHCKQSMKNVRLVFILLGLTSASNAQSFVLNNKIIESGIGLTIMNYETYNPTINERKKNKSANWVIPVAFEYAVAKRVGIGAEADFVNYFTERDSVTNAIADANSNDLYAKLNFHWV